MDLIATWHRATKPEPIKRRVEKTMAERLVELHGGVEKAHSCKDQWHRMGEPVLHPWTTYFRIAYIDATKDLSTTERASAQIALRFDD